jgi:hypothetical protein
MHMKRLGIVAACAFAITVSCSGPSTGNKSHDLLVGLPDAGRAEALADLIVASKQACGTATRTFFQGMNASKVATWNAGCTNGRNYAVHIEPNATGTTRVVDCELAKAVSNVECFVKSEAAK